MDVREYNRLKIYLIKGINPVGFSEKQKQQLQQKAKHFLIINDCLYKKNRRQEPTRPLKVLQENETEAILTYMHGELLTGHFGYDGTYQRIAAKYWWQGMGMTIKDFIKSCSIC